VRPRAQAGDETGFFGPLPHEPAFGFAGGVTFDVTLRLHFTRELVDGAARTIEAERVVAAETTGRVLRQLVRKGLVVGGGGAIGRIEALDL
jgi:hypothetical protein